LETTEEIITIPIYSEFLFPTLISYHFEVCRPPWTLHKTLVASEFRSSSYLINLDIVFSQADTHLRVLKSSRSVCF